MGRQKIVNVEKNTGTPRALPFKAGERERHYALLAAQIIALDKDKEKVKKRKDAIDRIKADIVAGGFLTDDQLALPIFPADPDDGDDDSEGDNTAPGASPEPS